VWLNTGDHDRLRRLAEALAARTWGADRSFFLVNGSSSGNHAYLLAAVGPATRSWSAVTCTSRCWWG
jgi:arginine/lysine/ornithine decarboxylase